METIIHSIPDSEMDFPESLKKLAGYLKSADHKVQNNFIFCQSTRRVSSILNLIFSHSFNPDFTEKEKNQFCFMNIERLKNIYSKLSRLIFSDESMRRKSEQVIGNLIQELEALCISVRHSKENPSSIFFSEDKKHTYSKACILRFGSFASSALINLYLDSKSISNTSFDSRDFMKTKYSPDHENSIVCSRQTINLIKDNFFFSNNNVVILQDGPARCIDTGEDTMIKPRVTISVFERIFNPEYIVRWGKHNF